jgi:membrane protein DedA with SNARE-associated domain
MEWISQYGYLGLFCLLMLGIIGLPVPDELLLTGAGYLTLKGDLDLLPTILAGFLGSTAGITVSYLLGRFAGHALIERYGGYVHFTHERLEKLHAWFERFGSWALFFGYYFAGIRHFTAFTAGTSKLELKRFAPFAYGGALVWTTTFVLLGHFIGEEWQRVSEQAHQVMEIVTAVLIVAGLIAYGVFKLRGRRATR